jgi:uncharacterized protein YeaO (DUF488 family)
LKKLFERESPKVALIGGAGEKKRSREGEMEMIFVLKRVYEPCAPEDGKRFLVDRLWPRGISKDAARIDLWLKEIAPSTELRKTFCHDPLKWQEFRSRYLEELAENEAAVKILLDHGSRGTVTLVYGAKDPEFNHANVLKEYLDSRKL